MNDKALLLDYSKLGIADNPRQSPNDCHRHFFQNERQMIISLFFMSILEIFGRPHQTEAEKQKIVAQTTQKIERQLKQYSNSSYGFRVSETTQNEPLYYTNHFFRKSGKGVTARCLSGDEIRKGYNSSYGFQIRRKEKSSPWRLSRLYRRDEILESINNSVHSSPDCFFDLLPMIDVLKHASFSINSADSTNGFCKISFTCNVEKDSDYILKGGHFLVTRDWDIASYEINLLLGGTAIHAIGNIDRDDKGLSMLIVRYVINNSIGYERTVERVSEEFDFGIEPFNIAGYGLPEPPIQTSRWMPLLAYLILAVIGLGLVYYAKTRMTPERR